MDKEKLPDNIIKFDAIKRVSGKGRNICKCGMKAKYIIDVKYYTVHCEICGARVEQFQALLTITNNMSTFNEQLNIMLKQREDIANYKPHRVV